MKRAKTEWAKLMLDKQFGKGWRRAKNRKAILEAYFKVAELFATYEAEKIKLVAMYKPNER